MGAKVDVKFVFCNLTKEDQKILVALEIMRYDDIIILNCQENMNKGKTYTYFSSLPEIFSVSNIQPYYPPYHYVMKADDDTYIRLENFVESLRPLPREDLYYGYVIPCPSMDPFVHYMSGMGYLVSWDVVEWIKDSDIPKKHLEGPEDKITYQDKATQTDIIEDDALEKILKTLTTLSLKVESMDNEIEKLKTNEVKLKSEAMT
ncbi:hypothetical protein BC332_18695 [Capsicum chinense]|nr:hypothetical protein BC332_18695 [Capsicum chinense]